MYVIAENLNSSDPAVHAALAAGDRRWIETRVRALVARGCDALDINAGTFGASEREVLGWLAEVVEPLSELPLSIDSARPQIVESVARERRSPPILNSIDVDEFVRGTLAPASAREGTRLVVQLRRGRQLPVSIEDRLAWTELVEQGAAAQGVALERIFLDAVMLPWGDDFAAGRGLREFVRCLARTTPTLRTLVGLSNVSYGHAEPLRLHAAWLDRLGSDGLGAVLLDALDPTCMAIARRTAPRD